MRSWTYAYSQLILWLLRWYECPTQVCNDLNLTVSMIASGARVWRCISTAKLQRWCPIFKPAFRQSFSELLSAREANSALEILVAWN